jgi:hypothetical protein
VAVLTLPIPGITGEDEKAALLLLLVPLPLFCLKADSRLFMANRVPGDAGRAAAGEDFHEQGD